MNSLCKTDNRLYRILALMCWIGMFFYPARPIAQTLTVERIDIRGNSKTRDAVILRQLSIQPNDSVNAAIIEDNYIRLQQTHFFSKVYFTTRPGSEKGRVIVQIDVRERRWPSVHVEGGYSEFEGWFLSPLSVRYNNPFGRGYGLALKSYIGDRMGGVSLLFNAPYIFNSDYWLNFEAFGRGHDYIHYLDETQWVQKTDMGGARFDFGGHTGLFKYLNFALQSKNVTPHKELHDEKADIKIYDLPTAIAADTAKARLNSGFITLSGDTRNNTDYPTRGIWASISAENTTEKLQETFRYTKIIADGRMYQKIGRYDVLALRLKIGQTDAETPFYERFYLGGAMSVRGFPERTLTPIGWGTHLLLSNLEYRFPLSRSGFPKHRWTAAFFVDTGAIWQSPSEISASDFTGSWGFGIRVRVPVLGLVRLDLAKPLLDEKARLHLSLGHTF